jgi:signal transducing adaptor molecule
VLELSKQDKGGRAAPSQTYQSPSGAASGSASGSGFGGQTSTATAANNAGRLASGSSYANTNGSGNGKGNGNGYANPAHTYEEYDPSQQAPPAQQPLDPNTATRVRAIYPFASAEVGELNFERGDVIKVLDRGFKEWWRGACNGKIGVRPPSSSTRWHEEATGGC